MSIGVFLTPVASSSLVSQCKAAVRTCAGLPTISVTLLSGNRISSPDARNSCQTTWLLQFRLQRVGTPIGQGY